MPKIILKMLPWTPPQQLMQQDPVAQPLSEQRASSELGNTGMVARQGEKEGGSRQTGGPVAGKCGHRRVWATTLPVGFDANRKLCSLS